MARLSSVLRAMPAILLGAALLAPFWDKPYTIDDPFFLEQARQVLADPLHPPNCLKLSYCVAANSGSVDICSNADGPSCANSREIL